MALIDISKFKNRTPIVKSSSGGESHYATFGFNEFLEDYIDKVADLIDEHYTRMTSILGNDLKNGTDSEFFKMMLECLTNGLGYQVSTKYQIDIVLGVMNVYIHYVNTNNCILIHYATEEQLENLIENASEEIGESDAGGRLLITKDKSIYIFKECIIPYIKNYINSKVKFTDLDKQVYDKMYNTIGDGKIMYNTLLCEFTDVPLSYKSADKENHALCYLMPERKEDGVYINGSNVASIEILRDYCYDVETARSIYYKYGNDRKDTPTSLIQRKALQSSRTPSVVQMFNVKSKRGIIDEFLQNMEANARRIGFALPPEEEDAEMKNDDIEQKALSAFPMDVLNELLEINMDGDYPILLPIISSSRPTVTESNYKDVAKLIYWLCVNRRGGYIFSTNGCQVCQYKEKYDGDILTSGIMLSIDKWVSFDWSYNDGMKDGIPADLHLSKLSSEEYLFSGSVKDKIKKLLRNSVSMLGAIPKAHVGYLLNEVYGLNPDVTKEFRDCISLLGCSIMCHQLVSSSDNVPCLNRYGDLKFYFVIADDRMSNYIYI